ncbi:MAG: carbohydrate kinase family protein [Candidatus Bathyarchaeota archaeon]|nr:carbohydrate kinase family protein [Candidatus Bathyarchaeota archaeon]
MNLAQSKKELQNYLESKTSVDFSVVVMPDFFLDRLISLDWNAQEFSKQLQDVVARKGGSLDGISQTDLNGGNAINVASALSALGVTVTPIVCTNSFGLNKIQYYLKNGNIDVSHIKIQPKASITTALEFKGGDEKVNVMIRDVGSLVDFGPQDLTESDYKVIEHADFVCLFNWAGTLRFGTELAETVFRRTKRGRGKTYFDTADPTPNQPQIPEVISKILKSVNVDILSLNENEAITYAAQIDSDINEHKTAGVSTELALKAARTLANHLSARIDLHTTEFSATLHRGSEVVVPTFKVQPQRATGAGDAWDAGNIYGDGCRLSDECRLLLANAVAACYLSSSEGTHPTKEQIVSFLRGS